MRNLENGLCCKLGTAGLLICLISLAASALATLTSVSYFYLACESLHYYGNNTPVYFDEFIIFFVLSLLCISWLITSLYLLKGVTTRRHEYIWPWLYWSIVAICFEVLYIIIYPALTDPYTSTHRLVLLIIHLYMFSCIYAIYEKDKNLSDSQAPVVYRPDQETVDLTP